jgi:hypothetical protein
MNRTAAALPRSINCFGVIMTEKTDVTFLLALLIVTIVGLVVSSATHAEEMLSAALPF